MGNAKNLIGEKFGRLLVKERFGISKDKKALWRCVCDCGSEKIIKSYQLTKQNGTKSCGCLHKEQLVKRNKSHGMSFTQEYNSYNAMKSRCNNKNNAMFYLYGGRGIRVCSSWIESFDNFLMDMGNKPTKKHSLERINVDGDYNKDNCIWATSKQQSNNKRNSKFIEYNGLRLTLSEWADNLKIDYSALFWRLNNGWSVEKSLLTKSGRYS